MGYGRHTDHLSTNTTKSEVFNVLWHLKKQGYSENTINFVRKALNVVQKGCGLNEPEKVKAFIARLDTRDSYKRNLCYAYEHYLRLHDMTWSRPKYYARDRLPKIPSERTIDMIIAASRPELALKLSISKETGLRPVELLSLKVKDVDLDSGIIYPSTVKHGSARALKISSKTLNLLKAHIFKKLLDNNDKLFNSTSAQYAKSFRYVRNKLAEKLADPQMGHKRLNTTLRYTQLIDIKDDEWIVKVASSLEEFTSLLESGFEYVSDYNIMKVLRKRK